MRGSLKGVLSRVDRLEERVRPGPEDLIAKLNMVSDEELYERIVELTKKSGGTEAVCRQMGWDPEKHSERMKMLRENASER